MARQIQCYEVTIHGEVCPSDSGKWCLYEDAAPYIVDKSLHIAQPTQPAICAHLKVNRLCYLWGHRGKKVCACCEAARKQQASA